MTPMAQIRESRHKSNKLGLLIGAVGIFTRLACFITTPYVLNRRNLPITNLCPPRRRGDPQMAPITQINQADEFVIPVSALGILDGVLCSVPALICVICG
jgi:hypothetical protein